MPRMKAEDRRRQLLESALRCFARHGYRGTTTARIAAEAGVSEPIIYRHFANKHDLFIALIDKVGDDVLRSWEEATSRSADPLEKLEILLYRNPATADPETARVYRILFHASIEVGEPAIQNAIREHYKRYVHSIATTMSEAQEVGLIRDDVPAEWLAWQIVHAAVGFAMIRPLDIPGHKDLTFVRGTIQLLLELLTRNRVVVGAAASDPLATWSLQHE